MRYTHFRQFFSPLALFQPLRLCQVETPLYTVAMSHNLQQLKREFFEHLEIEKGRSVKTVENYAHYLEEFFLFAAITSPKDITDDLVREFRIFLNRRPAQRGGHKEAATLKRKTQNYYLIALRMFLKYCARRGISTLAADRIELAKVPERSLDLITAVELERLLKAPNGSDIKSLRDRAMLELLFSTGLRVSELCSLPRDLDLSRDEFSVRGKGEKIRVVFLSPTAKDALKTYLVQRADMDDALFVSLPISDLQPPTSDPRLTPRTVQRIVKHYAIKAGISKTVSPHTIRHSFATDLLQNGADLRSVQALLGHANIATTQVYTHVTDQHLHDVHRAFHGKRRR